VVVDGRADCGLASLVWTRQKSGFFALFLRIYELERSPDVNLPPYHPDADLSCFAPGGAYEKENPAEWGWACPPVVEVRRKDWANGEFQTIPMCKYRRKRGITGWNDVTKPGVICEPTWGHNQVRCFCSALIMGDQLVNVYIHKLTGK
jgi:hypothetical protein